MFTVIGKIDGITQQVTYTFENGRGGLSGDKMIMFLIQWELDAKTIVGPIGQYMEVDMDNPLSMLFALKKCYDLIEKIDGEVPVADIIPEDCIC